MSAPVVLNLIHTHYHNSNLSWRTVSIAPDKDWRQLGIYPPLFALIGYSNFKLES